MILNVDNTRIKTLRPLISPAILLEDIPATETVAEGVDVHRKAISNIFSGKDDRLVVVVGPCSIHDTKAALEYAALLKPVADQFAGELLMVMRVYFEKPRTVVGWKGLINDPFIDNSFQINKGLRLARQLMVEIAELGLPIGTEFLDMITPQYIADLVSWAAIGARTTESQIHRELASGLSMPVGFKNGTGGNIQMAIDAVRSARCPHWFPSVTKQGVAAIFGTKGNDDCHVILRGGTRTGTNFGKEWVSKTAQQLEEQGLHPYQMIDCSHANSEKKPERQIDVAKALGEQISAGSSAVAGVMLESHLVAGTQKYVADGEMVYGQSITDGCISFDQTVPVLEGLAAAVKARRKG